MEQADVAIIGGGAAGLAAAIFAAEAAGPGKRVVILDGARTLGAKILVSGGGRCNVTHHEVRPEDFNGSQKIVRNILAAFNVEATVRWFASMGVELKREPTGKLFPVTDSAKTILAALVRRSGELKITLNSGCRVNAVTAPSDANASFTIAHTNGTTLAGKIILSTGGCSLPLSGSDGSGWEIVRKLGHTVTPTYAALVPLVLAPQMFHAAVSGIAQDVELSTIIAGKRIDHRTGSLLWTHFGVSGPVVMDASRHWTVAHETGQSPTMLCNLLPGESFENTEQWLMLSTTARPRASMLNHLTARLPERVAAALLKHVGIDPATVAAQLCAMLVGALVHTLTALVLPVVQHRGWNYAEVTAGGVPLNEIDFRTMQSRKVRGLFLAGEILDCDGRIGGFNFQWAWATGHLAGARQRTRNAAA